MAKPFTVLVADPHSVARAGIRATLAKAHCTVVAEAENGRDAVRLAIKHQPGLALLDVPLPKLNGLDVARQILTAGLTTRVMMLTAIVDDFTLERANAIGVHGYLCKASPIAMLCEAIKSIRYGQNWYGPAMREHLKRRQNHPDYAKKDPIKITDREVDVLTLIAERFQNKAIAGELGVSEKTVDHHRQQLMKKLDIHDIAGLTHYAIRCGFIRAQ